MILNNKLPQILTDMGATLFDRFKAVGNTLNDNDEYISELFNLLPNKIKQSTVFKDRLTGNYLYNFGKPLEIESSTVHCFGNTQNHDVKNLYRTIKSAKKYLEKDELAHYIQKINDPNKHSDFLFEMRPLIHLKKDVKVEYESKENCIGNKNVDWLLKDNNWIISFDVKNRIKSIVNHLKYIINDLLRSFRSGISAKNIVPPKAPDPADLFKSTVSKFNDRKDNKTLQGVWITTGITEDKNKLNEYFHSLNSKKIQFAIITDWSKDAYILAKDELYKPVLIEFFNLKELNNFACLDYKQ